MKKFATASGEPPLLHRNSANLMQSMLDEVKNSITILPELQALIPTLQVSEYEQLEKNIRVDGCREALLIWQTTQRVIDGLEDNTPLNVLIDGHNRYSICIKNNIDFKVMLREFPTLQAVRDFMIDNQLGRRNLTPEQMSYLRGLKYRNERQAIGRPVQDGLSAVQNDAEINLVERTQDRLAKEFNVSPRTIHRDREYSEGIDRLTPELKRDVLTGKQKLSRELIRAVGRAVPVGDTPLSLPELNSYNESASSDTTEEAVSKNEAVVIAIKEIVSQTTKLDPASPTFQKACDELITMITEVKQMSC
ncbi:ParB N-terminal domain-containing protein [Spirosoma flavum]|uniref:ParB N-terminal domain-containing protein n=1 Tax=Spirosoma flavum TaxID=2048557 RepID=A0ABW6AKH9_9BACT